MEPCVTRSYAANRRAVSITHGTAYTLSLSHDGIAMRYSRWAMMRTNPRSLLGDWGVTSARVFINTHGSCDAFIITWGRFVHPRDAPQIAPTTVARWLSFLPRLWMTKMYQPMYDWMAEELPVPYCFWPSDPLRVFRELAPGRTFLENEG